jgi:hypothetical protein
MQPFVLLLNAECLAENKKLKSLIYNPRSVPLRFTNSDYPFGIFKLFLVLKNNKNEISNLV